VEDPVNDSWRKFTKTFELCPGAYDIQPGSIQVNSDNAEEFYFNGVLVGSDGEVQGAYYDNQEWNTVKSWAITPQPGVNILDFIVRNYACYSPTRSGSYFCGTPPNPQSNPAGLIYKAELIYKCPLQVTIDIKPGSDPNCFNSDGHGVIPVAILGSADFDASTVNPFTVSLDGAGVRVKGKSGNAGSLEDVNGDGFQDLVVQILDDSSYSFGDTTATLNGFTYDGVPIVGTDTICIRPPKLPPILVVSSVQNFSGEGWAGWSCPPEYPNVIDGGVSKTSTQPWTPADYPVVQGPAKPGVTVGGSTYPDYPHYDYTPPEEGWVVQNGGTAQNLYIYVYCGQ